MLEAEDSRADEVLDRGKVGDLENPKFKIPKETSTL